MSNKDLGNKFERDLCIILAKNGFWAYNTPNKANGQPVDIIAARNGQAYLIDAKVCENNYFSFARLEMNQINSMKLFEHNGNNGGIFALRLSDGTIWMLYRQQIANLMMLGYKGMTQKDIQENAFYIDDWMVEVC